MTPLPIQHFTATSCIGRGQAAMLESLQQARSGLKPCDFETVSLDTQIGEVAGVDDVRLPPALVAYDCRNNRLAQLGLEQDGFAGAVRASAARWGSDRVGVFIGTSTAGILETEIAFRQRDAVTGDCRPVSTTATIRTPSRSATTCAARSGWKDRPPRSARPAPRAPRRSQPRSA